MNTTRRHRKVLRDNIQGVTNPAIHRLCRRGGVKRLSGLIYEESRGVLKVFLENVIRDTVTYTEHSRRKTVTALDVIYALKRQGRDLYGFGGYQVHNTNRKKPVNKKTIKKNKSPQQRVPQNIPPVINDTQSQVRDISPQSYEPFDFETDENLRIRIDAENTRKREELEKKKKTLEEMQKMEKHLEQIQREFQQNEENKIKSKKITQKFNTLKQKIRNKEFMDSIRELKMKKNLQKQVQGLEEMNDFQRSIEKLEKDIHDKVSRKKDIKEKAQQIKHLKKQKDEIREDFKTLLSDFQAEMTVKIDSISRVLQAQKKQKTPSPILQSPYIDDSGIIFDQNNTDVPVNPEDMYNDTELQLDDDFFQNLLSIRADRKEEIIHQDLSGMLDTFACRKNFNFCLSLGLNSYDVLQSLTLSDVIQVLRQNNNNQLLN